MSWLAIILSVVFAAVGALHALWALRIWWPIADEAQLARTVVGAQGITQMPGRAITWAVVAVIALGLGIVAQLVGWIALPVPTWLSQCAGWAMAGVLILRGISSYVPPVSRLPQEAPFRALNLWLFSPLILALGLGVAVLTSGAA